MIRKKNNGITSLEIVLGVLTLGILVLILFSPHPNINSIQKEQSRDLAKNGPNELLIAEHSPENASAIDLHEKITQPTHQIKTSANASATSSLKGEKKDNLPTGKHPEGIAKNPALSSPLAITPPTASQEDELELDLREILDTSRPFQERENSIDSLVQLSDEHSIKMLMAIGDENTYLNSFAIEALGKISQKNPIVEEYLKSKLADPDVKIANAAIRSYAQLEGEAAVPTLVETMEALDTRQDGFSEGLRTEAIQQLARTGSPQALPILVKEFSRASQPGWSLEYGSALIESIKQIADAGTSNTIHEYADLLTGQQASLPQDPSIQNYWKNKIEEARAAAGFLNGDLPIQEDLQTIDTTQSEIETTQHETSVTN